MISISFPRLRARLDALAEVGAIDGGGNARLALTDADREGRDLVVTWMRDLGLGVTIDGMGNVVATWPADATDPPVLTGSHIDTVATGGRYDGCLGVLAGLEAIETIITEDVRTQHPVAVAFFTDEEGSRFAPDMLGSLVFAGGLAVEDARAIVGIDGCEVGAELDRIGYAGMAPCPASPPRAYVELHIEQGPVLEAHGSRIGVVTGVQGISWTELEIRGQSNHAGTTPMAMRRDAAYAAASIAVQVRRLAEEVGPPQVATVGRLDVHPDLVNVVAARAVMSVDLRNTEESVLRHAERRLDQIVAEAADAEGVEITARRTARFEPVTFDADIVDLVERTARAHGLPCERLPSGAGHDAQMLARVCPSGMIFVPSAGGVSHNPAEHTDDADLEAGANVLLHCLLELAGGPAAGR